MTPTPPEVVPAQVDREAAADYGRYRLFSGLSADGIECGRADGNDLVQAFARHRLATIEDCARVLGEADFALSAARTYLTDHMEAQPNEETEADLGNVDSALTAIRNLAPPPPPVDVGEGG